ncbi:hypothetical protein [Paenibacillus pini]|nr:hypothetical protein [Paenibacillus pini]
MEQIHAYFDLQNAKFLDGSYFFFRPYQNVLGIGEISAAFF